MAILSSVALALNIAKATGIAERLGRALGGEPGEKTAAKIVAIAEQVTGASSGEEALSQLQQSNEARAKFKLAVAAQEQELLTLQLDDIADARRMYTHENQQADAIATAIIRQNHWLALIMIIGNALTLAFIDDKTIALALGNMFGAGTAALWQERQQVIGFFFGSSIGSKIKDKFKGN